MKRNNNLTKNLFLSLSSQAASLAVSLILSLVVPKFIDEYQYAYWQTYVLYVGYVGGLHFGLLDGIVLRYSQYDYDELDKPRIRSQFKILFVSVCILSLTIIAFALLFLDGNTRTITILVSLGIITKQLTGYNSYTFQITNRISKFAAMTMIQRLSYGAIVVGLLLGKVKIFYWICFAELIGDMIGFAISSRSNKNMYFGETLSRSEAIKEWKTNVSAGIILMLANWSSMLLLGGAKMVVQWRWDELTFGKISFAVSISNLFLVFVNAISVVLFPSLKRMNQEQLPNLYKKLRSSVSIVLFAVMAFYFPGCFILNAYLPKYAESLIYLGLLLPLIIFSSKVTLLTNNYLKAYRLEKEMLKINLISIITAIVLYLVTAYIFSNLIALVICIVMSNMLKSVLSEITVSRIIKLSFTKDIFVELIMTCIFMLLSYVFDWKLGFILYVITLGCYVFYNRDAVLEISTAVKTKIHHRKN